MAEATCADRSHALGESLHATASIAHRWVLLEQPGPWGHDAPSESRLPAEVAAALQARARAHGFRFLLLRRASPSLYGLRRCFFAHSARSTQWIEELVVVDPEELLAVDFSLLARGTPTGQGLPRSEPVFMVCTNGRHDPCCARLGRPIVRSLLPAVGDAAWECSHIGGDRFAGNLVCLPHGFYFGGLGPAQASRVVESYRHGWLELEHYRGRAGDPYAVQAAEFYLRREEHLFGIDDVAPLYYGKLRTGVIETEFSGPSDRRFRVVGAVARSEKPRPLTCTSTTPERPMTYTLLELESI